MSELLNAIEGMRNTAQIFKKIYRGHANELKAIEMSLRQAGSMISQPEWHSEAGFKNFLVTFGLALAVLAKLDDSINFGVFGTMALNAVCQECAERKFKVSFTDDGAVFD